ncbi:nucleotide disphospho-sugar-binding domain-containing protein [Streptomyces sp. NPDC057617]|uniref:nucleotide disphospho-sugar-binding domain-containing protein n=1 Tax=Streptomyces sp. NPDC057617 TaxID=3346184 RepID=UPI003673FE2F
MTRFLLVVPPLVGHVNPLVGVADELVRRGHEVAWAGHAGQIRRLAGADATVYDCVIPGGGLSRPPGLTGPAAFRFLWAEFFVPLADAMAPGVDAAIDAFRPDLVLTDQHAVAGALVAERRGIVHVTSATTSAELVDPLGGMPKVGAWLRELLGGLRARIGDPAHTGDPRFSPHGVIAFTGRELLGDAPPPHDRTYLVGPAIAPRADRSDFPWDELDPARSTVLVSLGTANADAGGRFLAEAVTALDRLRDRVQGVVVDPGRTLDPASVPDGVLVREHVPQLDLLARVDAVVCHAGHNTVCESLWHGLPLVLAPIRDDQPIVAGQVVDAGAGVRVRFGRVDAERLAAAVETVLDPTGGHRAAAETIGRSLRAAGGQSAAADHLERIAGEGPAPASAPDVAPVTSEPGSARPESAPVRAERAVVRPESAPVRAEPAPVRPESAPAADPVPVPAEPARTSR